MAASRAFSLGSNAAPKYKKPKPPKVTIAIGLICNRRNGKNGSILLASDSQTTYGATKSLDARKINVIDFADAKVLVAQAGTADLAAKAIDIMRSKATNKPLEDAETVCRIAEESVREIRNYLVQLNSGCNFSDEAWKRFFREDNCFTLMVAYYFQSKPYLFTIDIDWCLAIRVTANYKAIGCGAYLGEFLIREHRQVDPNFDFALPIAVSVIEKTIDNVDGCGRPTWVGIVHPVLDNILELRKKLPQGNYLNSLASLIPKRIVNLIIAELATAEQKTKDLQKEQLNGMLRNVNSKLNLDTILEDLMNELENE